MVLLKMLFCTEYEHIPFFFFSINFLELCGFPKQGILSKLFKVSTNMLTNIIMASYILLFFTAFKLQHTIESMGEKNKTNKLKESEVTKEALIKLIKIIFMVKKHLARTVNYKDFVRFIGSDIGDSILLEYLKYTDCHKNEC